MLWRPCGARSRVHIGAQLRSYEPRGAMSCVSAMSRGEQIAKPAEWDTHAAGAFFVLWPGRQESDRSREMLDLAWNDHLPRAPRPLLRRGRTLMNRALSITPLLLLAVVVACQDRSVAPTAARPSFAAAGPAACPAHATVAVSDEPSLLSAIASAHPNDTIALNGMIELTHAAAFVTTDGLTLTCASPGSGLQARANAGIDRLVLVFSKHVRVEHLALD